jgi:signal transduction histidine kinase
MVSPGVRPSPWYAALTSAGQQGYVPVLLAAFLFLAFGLWLVPRTLGMHYLLVSRLTNRVQRLSETRTDAVDTAAAELRRVERDLHDGAQARLVALGMSLRAAERLFATSPGPRSP